VKESRRFFPSFRVLTRLLDTLLEEDAATKTILSQKSGINYTRLLKHLDWMEEKGIIELGVRRHKVIIRLTKDGRAFAAMLARNS